MNQQIGAGDGNCILCKWRRLPQSSLFFEGTLKIMVYGGFLSLVFLEVNQQACANNGNSYWHVRSHFFDCKCASIRFLSLHAGRFRQRTLECCISKVDFIGQGMLFGPWTFPIRILVGCSRFFHQVFWIHDDLGSFLPLKHAYQKVVFTIATRSGGFQHSIV